MSKTSHDLRGTRRFRSRALVVFLAAVSTSTAAAHAQGIQQSHGPVSEEIRLFNLYVTLESNPDLSSALDLSPDQRRELREIVAEFRKRQSARLETFRRDMQAGDRMLAQKLYVEENRELRDETYQRFEVALLDHQVKRLKQILRQQSVRQLGWPGGPQYSLSNDSLSLPLQVAKDLELTQHEIDSLEEAVEQIRDEMQAEIQRAKEKALEKVLGELTSEQRKKFRELVGDPYDFEASQLSRMEELRRQSEERARKAAEERAAKQRAAAENSAGG